MSTVLNFVCSVILIASCMVEYFLIRKGEIPHLVWEVAFETYLEKAVVLYVNVLSIFFALITAFMGGKVFAIYLLLFGVVFSVCYLCFKGVLLCRRK